MQMKKEASKTPWICGRLVFFLAHSYGHTASKFARSFYLP